MKKQKNAKRNLPKVNFPKWMKWNDREDYQNPGVYVLAHFPKKPRSKVNMLAKEIIYIGETHTSGRTLIKRWNEFNYSAHSGKKRHAGGRTYHKKFRENKFKQLYVAGWPISIDNKDLPSAYIQFCERKFILDYVKKYGHLPVCNKK
jgi:hypothetical protein